MGRVEKHAFHALTPTCAPGRGVRSQRARRNATGEPAVSNDRGAAGEGRMPDSPGPHDCGLLASCRQGHRVRQATGWHSVIRTPTPAREYHPRASINSFRLFDFFFSNHRRSILPTRRTIRRRVLYSRSRFQVLIPGLDSGSCNPRRNGDGDTQCLHRSARLGAPNGPDQ